MFLCLKIIYDRKGEKANEFIMEQLEYALISWLKKVLPNANVSLTPIIGDASFRKYYRVKSGAYSFILMDARAEKEHLKPYLFIQNILKNIGIYVPDCFAKDLDHGLLLLTDFGDRLLLDHLTQENVESNYIQLIDLIIKMQDISLTQHAFLPHFDKNHIFYELNLFVTWYLESYLKLNLTVNEQRLIKETFNFLTEKLLAQPQVFIHRDYHSRNIMCVENNSFGIIDFQDAMIGPFTYDLVSLIKDCYIAWPKEKLHSWLLYFYNNSPIAELLEFAEAKEAFELCGLQRHLKVLGIFSRLALRDQKHQYLDNLPLVLRYVMHCLETQPLLQNFYTFMQSKVLTEL